MLELACLEFCPKLATFTTSRQQAVEEKRFLATNLHVGVITVRIVAISMLEWRLSLSIQISLFIGIHLTIHSIPCFSIWHPVESRKLPVYVLPCEYMIPIFCNNRHQDAYEGCTPSLLRLYALVITQQ